MSTLQPPSFLHSGVIPPLSVVTPGEHGNVDIQLVHWQEVFFVRVEMLLGTRGCSAQTEGGPQLSAKRDTMLKWNWNRDNLHNFFHFPKEDSKDFWTHLWKRCWTRSVGYESHCLFSLLQVRVSVCKPLTIQAIDKWSKLLFIMAELEHWMEVPC